MEAECGWWVSRDERDTHIATHADRRREGEHMGGFETVGVAGSAQALGWADTIDAHIEGADLGRLTGPVP